MFIGRIYALWPLGTWFEPALVAFKIFSTLEKSKLDYWIYSFGYRVWLPDLQPQQVTNIALCMGRSKGQSVFFLFLSQYVGRSKEKSFKHAFNTVSTVGPPLSEHPGTKSS